MDSISAELFGVPGTSHGLVGGFGRTCWFKGLTTAAIGMTAAVGIAAGIGPLWVPVLSAACAWVILYAFARIEKS